MTRREAYLYLRATGRWHVWHAAIVLGYPEASPHDTYIMCPATEWAITPGEKKALRVLLSHPGVYLGGGEMYRLCHARDMVW